MGDKQQSAYLSSSFSSLVPDFLKEAKSDSVGSSLSPEALWQ